MGLFFLIFINPLSSFSEKLFEAKTSKESSSFYSIKIKNNEIWIKNKQDKKINFIQFSNFDLKNLNAEKIKIIEIENGKKRFYIANKGALKDNILSLKELTYFDIVDESSQKISNYNLNVNFRQNDIINSISNYKHIPFYKYNSHIKSLQKFNLYSETVSFHYISEIFKPIFLLILSFIVMGFASKFKRNESFFKILFISISFGFIFFIFNEVLSGITIAKIIPFWFSYTILIIFSLIIGLYQSINIEIK